MQLAVFATVCFASTVQAASLQAFPSYNILQTEEIEFAQSFDEVAFSQLLSDIAVHDNTPVRDHDLFMQSMSEADADIMTTLLANVEANAKTLTFTEGTAEDFLGIGAAVGRIQANQETAMHKVIAAKKELYDGANAIVHGNISEGTMQVLHGAAASTAIGVEMTVNNQMIVQGTVLNVSKEVGEHAIFGIGAALEIGGEAFQALLEAAIAAGDLVTMAMGYHVRDILEFKNDFKLLMTKPKLVHVPLLVMHMMKKMPVIGDIITIGVSGARIFDRAVNGESETCYRSGFELRSFKHNTEECASPGNLVNKSCILPCPPGKSAASLICLTKCPRKFPHPCGVMCTATAELCKSDSLISQTADVINAGITIAHAAGDAASGNILGIFAKGFSLIDEFAHPFC